MTDGGGGITTRARAGATRAPDDDAPASGDARRRWIALGLLVLASAVVGVDMTVLNLAVPAISRDLAPSGGQLLWIVDVYGFMSAGSLILMGALGDRIGRRRLLLWGGASFAVASCLAAVAPTPGALIAARALLGVAGATLMPCALSLAADMFRSRHERTLAVGILVASVSAGTAVGPLLGGAVLDRLHWGWVFLLGVPPMVVLVLLGPVLLPAHRPGRTARPDLPSAVAATAAVLLVVYGLKQLAAAGPGLGVAAWLGAGAAMGTWFVVRQLALPDPLLDVRLFGTARVAAALGALLTGIFVLHAAYLFIAQYHQLVVGLSPLEAGLWSAPAAGGVILGSTIAPRLARRLDPALVVAGALVVTAAGFVLLGQTTPASGPLPPAVSAVVISLGLGPLMTLATALVVASAPRERAGAAASLSETSGVLGGALGVAVLGSVGTAVYRARLSDPVLAALPAAAADDARETLGGATAAASLLPDDGSLELLGAARAAFVDGLVAAAVTSAGLVLAAAAVALALLRTTDPGAARRRGGGPGR